MNESLRCAWDAYQKKKVDRILICGDFNYPNIDWLNVEVPSATTKSGLSSVELQFKSLVKQLDVVQNVAEKTFQRDVGEKTNTLDLVLTEKERRCRNMKFEQPLGGVKQGHMQISWEYKFKNKGILRKLFFCISN